MKTTRTTELFALTTITFAAACGAAPTEDVTQQAAEIVAQALVPPTPLAYGDATGMTSSTGNIYWTSAGTSSLGQTAGSLMRMSKTNAPGQETTLYTAAGGFGFSFGNVVWGLEGTYYAYVVVNYSRLAQLRSEIVRVPLAGGTPQVIALSPAFIGARDVATDGNALYWSDLGGIRKIALPGGGAVTTLATGTGIAHISLDASNVYFGEGASIMRVSKGGGLVSTVRGLSSELTALYVAPDFAFIFWGEANGAMRKLYTDNAWVATYQEPTPGRSVTSVFGDSTHLAWTDCAEPGDLDCNVGGFQDSRAILARPVYANGAAHVQLDSAAIYWGDSTGVRRLNWW